MKARERLFLVVPPFIGRRILDAIGPRAEEVFKDGKRNPRGWGPLLAPLEFFDAGEIARAIDNYARIEKGWEVPFLGGNPPVFTPWCGYETRRVAYTLCPYAARRLYEWYSHFNKWGCWMKMKQL